MLDILFILGRHYSAVVMMEILDFRMSVFRIGKRSFTKYYNVMRTLKVINCIDNTFAHRPKSATFFLAHLEDRTMDDKIIYILLQSNYVSTHPSLNSRVSIMPKQKTSTNDSKESGMVTEC